MQKQNEYILLLLFLTLSIVPSLFFVILQLQSLTIGVTAAILLLVCVLLIKYPLLKIDTKPVFLINLFCALLMLFSFLNIYSEEKVFFSIIILYIFLTAALFFSFILVGEGVEIVKSAIVKVTIILSLLGWLSFLIEIEVLGYDRYVKSVLFFYEPSHFALVFGIFFISAINLNISKYLKLYLFLSTLTFGMLFPNVTILVYFFIGFALSIKKFSTSLIALFIFMSLFTLLILFQPDFFSYYFDRVNFSDGNDNLSALVYLQGWLESYKSIIESDGIGLGFQMAGTNSPSIIAEKIYILADMYLNREDGGFLAAKLIIEFGFIGVFLVLGYLVLFITSFIRLRLSTYPKNTFLFISDLFFVGFFVDMFIRSAGYFTLGMFLFIVALFLRFNKCSLHISK